MDFKPGWGEKKMRHYRKAIKSLQEGSPVHTRAIKYFIISLQRFKRKEQTSLSTTMLNGLI